jgi:hypothetical protein
MLLQLVEPTAGRALLFGGRYRDLERPASRVGAVLEAADFHPGRSGRDHLVALALALGREREDGNWFLSRERAAAERVDAALALVELREAAERRVGSYSLGMRQRLGLAGALLGDPEPSIDRRGVAILFEAMRKIFSFPNPVDETSARLVAGAVAVLALAAIGFQEGMLLPILAYGFVARALTGPTLSPLGQLATRVVTPRLQVRHRYAPGPAKRFAQTIGAVFTVSATLLYYLAGTHTAAFALVGVLALFASLEAGLGICVGCRMFYVGMRLGLVPAGVCVECARVSPERAA